MELLLWMNVLNLLVAVVLATHNAMCIVHRAHGYWRRRRAGEGVEETAGERRSSWAFLPFNPAFTFSLLAIPSTLITLLRRHTFTSTSLPSPVIMEMCLQIACWCSYLLQAWTGAWMLAEKAWPRDEKGELVGTRREMRRAAVVFCVSTSGAFTAVLVTSLRFTRILGTTTSPSRALGAALRILHDNLALNRSPSFRSVEAVWPSIRKAGLAVLEAEKAQRPTRTRFFLTLSFLFFLLTLLSLLSLFSIFRQARRHSLLLGNRKRRDQLFSHSRTRSETALVESVELSERSGVGAPRTGVAREEGSIKGRPSRLRWTVAASLLSSFSTFSLSVFFLHFAQIRSASVNLVDLTFPAWVATSGTTAVLSGFLVSRRTV